MLFFIFITVLIAVGAIIDSLLPADSLFEDFYTSENSNLVGQDDFSVLSSNPGDPTFDRFQKLDFDDLPYLTSNDQASSDPSDQLFDSEYLNSALDTSCNIGKRDGEACSVDPLPQSPLEFSDLMQMGNTVIKGDPFLAPITIELEGNSPGKCVNLQHPVNLCCKGPLGTVAASYWPLTVYETISGCRPGR